MEGSAVVGSIGGYLSTACLANITDSRMYPGQYIISNSKTIAARFQYDGDFCLHTISSSPYSLGFLNPQYWSQSWCMGVKNSKPGYVEVSSKGFLQLVSTTGTIYWRSANAGQNNEGALIMQDDHNLVLYADTVNYVPKWACGGGGPFGYFDSSSKYHTTSTCSIAGSDINKTCKNVNVLTAVNNWIGSSINASTNMYVGDYMVNEDKTKAVQLQKNGDLCIFKLPASTTDYIQSSNSLWELTWCLGVTDADPYYASVNQANGKLELYTTNGTTYWQSGSVDTSNTATYYLSLQTDSNLVLYAGSSSSPRWACGGSGPYNYYKGSVYYDTTTYKCSLTPSTPVTNVTDDSSSTPDYYLPVFYTCAAVFFLIVFGAIYMCRRHCMKNALNARHQQHVSQLHPYQYTPTPPPPQSSAPIAPQPSGPSYSNPPSTVTFYQPSQYPTVAMPQPNYPIVYAVPVQQPPRGQMGNYELVSSDYYENASAPVAEAYVI